MIHLPDWTPADQARHRAELTDALTTLEARGRYPRRPRQPQSPPPASNPVRRDGHATGSTLEELLDAW